MNSGESRPLRGYAAMRDAMKAQGGKGPIEILLDFANNRLECLWCRGAKMETTLAGKTIETQVSAL